MLVLSRKLQEQILFPSLNIRITVLSVGKNRVQLGIEAPPEIDVTRPQAVTTSKVEFPHMDEHVIFDVVDYREDSRGTVSLQACH